MAYTVTELDARIRALEDALASGTLTAVFPDKSSVTYPTPAQLKEAIAYFAALRDAAVATAAGTTTRPKRLILCPTSGVC